MNRIACLSIALLLTASLHACSFPANPGTSPATLVPVTPTILPAASSTSTPAVLIASPTAPDTFIPPAKPSPTVLPSPTPVPPSPTPVCDRASPGNPVDLTIPDDTDMLPGQRFAKTWRLINSGACTWTRDYAVVWWSGETFNAPVQMKFTNPVLPGRGVDITADMIAPEKTGTYQSTWKLQNARGTVFGIGPSGDAPFWVRIRVVEPEPPTPTAVISTPTVAVYSGGLANLSPNSSLDFDSNQVNTGSGDDLALPGRRGILPTSLRPRTARRWVPLG